VSEITSEDRKKCFIIYLNTPRMVRQNRLKVNRGWTDEDIAKRTKLDYEKFNFFDDYDMEITAPQF
jgi:guanylate kinase